MYIICRNTIVMISTFFHLTKISFGSLWFWLFLDWFFNRFLCQNTLVFGFGVHCGIHLIVKWSLLSNCKKNSCQSFNTKLIHSDTLNIYCIPATKISVHGHINIIKNSNAATKFNLPSPVPCTRRKLSFWKFFALLRTDDI